MYTLLRPLLFRFDAETAHHLTLFSLQAAYRLGLSRLIAPPASGEPVSCMGITFGPGGGFSGGSLVLSTLDFGSDTDAASSLARALETAPPIAVRMVNARSAFL